MAYLGEASGFIVLHHFMCSSLIFFAMLFGACCSFSQRFSIWRLVVLSCMAMHSKAHDKVSFLDAAHGLNHDFAFRLCYRPSGCMHAVSLLD